MNIGSNMHIGGLASGMDIDSKIDKLMEAHRKPVNKLEQEKQELEWKRDDYRTVNKLLDNFRSTVSNMKMEGTYMATKAASSNESVVTVSASSSASEGSHSVNVGQLAQKASVTSGVTGIEGSTDPLSDIGDLNVDGTEKLTINGTDIELDTNSENIYDLVDKINNEDDININASYDKGVDRLYLKADETGTSGDFKIEYTNLSEQLNITSGSTAGNFLDTSGDTSGEPSTVNAGQNVEVTIDGVDYKDGEFSSNQFTLNDVTYNLHNTSDSDVTVDVSRNTDQIVENVKGFVEEYNKTIEAINTKLDEPYYREYGPLSDDQREQLTDDQINKWINKAKTGLLRNDPILSNVKDKMRYTMSAIVPDASGEYDSLSDVGIKQEDPLNYESDQLSVNESKLRDAVENNPESVKELFTKDPGSEDYYDKGIARRLLDDLENGMDRITTKAGGSDTHVKGNMTKEMERIDDRIEQKEERLSRMEERYWDQFTRMEKAIQKMNQQSAWIQQQMGGGGMM